MRRRVPARWRLLALVAAQVPAVAMAQSPGPPKPPQAPPIPSASAPPAPAQPPGSALPPIPPAPAPPIPPAAPSTPAAAPSAPPAASGGPAEPETRDSTVVLEGTKPKAAAAGAPPTLPRELAPNVKGASRVALADRRKGPLTIEELVNAPVVSASNRLESTLSAPAWVLVISAKDIQDRGYTDLSQVLDDLPGMDVIRPYGDIYATSYWRGYRKGAGSDPYLVMIDGVVFNSLFYRDTQILATFPLTNIDHIEVVYGPASAVYGPNAAMGVINVITADGAARQKNNELGPALESRVTFGGPQRNLAVFRDSSKIADATVSYVTKDYRLRLTARVENSVLDRSIEDNFEFTKNKYYGDPQLWGQGTLQLYGNMAGSFRSVDQKRAYDARLYLGEGTEIAAQYFELQTGYGTRYAADRWQANTPWTDSELSIYGRHTAKLSPTVVSTSFIQYRRSDVASPSYGLFRGRTPTGQLDALGPTFEAYEAPNSAVVLQQAFDIDVAHNLLMDQDSLAVATGVRFEHQSLTGYYYDTANVTYPATAPDAATALQQARNNLSPGSQELQKYVPYDEIGAYLLGRYNFPKANAIHAGFRLDHGSLSGDTHVTVRGGYVGTFDPLTIKLLYGQSVYDPNAFDRYRAPNIESERSQTVEANVELTVWKLALHGDVYYVDYAHPIIALPDGTEKNLSTRRVAGGDLGARLIMPPVSAWAYYSRFIVADQSINDTSVGPIGDLAIDKVWAGVTFDKGPFTATLLGRYVGPREPVVSNPLGRIPPYVILDANMRVAHVFVDGMWLAFRVANLLDTVYSHPGMQTAGSGATPGTWNGTTYVGGSLDDFNSRLPQPRRAFYLTLGLDL